MRKDGPDLLEKATGPAHVRLHTGPSFTDTPRTREGPPDRPVPMTIRERRLAARSLLVDEPCPPLRTPAPPSPPGRASAAPTPVGVHVPRSESRLNAAG